MPTMNNPILAEIKKEIWAMEPKALASLCGRVSQMAAIPIAISEIKIETKRPMQINGDVATIIVSGVLMKSVPSFFKWFGIDATEYGQITEQINEALGNGNVSSIFLHISSPGGTVAGVSETASAIAAANKQKPVTAYIEDLGASGAYYLASQAGSIIANPNGEIGSIGVYSVYEDLSKMAEMEGSKVIIISSGEHKGMGVPGAPITENQIAAVQGVIDGMADNFVSAVAMGRKMSRDKAKELATGQTWIASAALKLGLIDSITNGINGISDFPKKTTKTNQTNSKGKTMSETETQIDEKAIAEAAKTAATTAERKRMGDLKAAFPGDPAFAMDQFAAGSDVTMAKAAYSDILAAKNAELAKENGELKTARGTGGKVEGADPVESVADSQATAGSDFMAAAKARAAEKKISIKAAMQEIRAENPQAHNDFLAGCSKKKVQVSGKAERISK